MRTGWLGRAGRVAEKRGGCTTQASLRENTVVAKTWWIHHGAGFPLERGGPRRLQSSMSPCLHSGYPRSLGDFSGAGVDGGSRFRSLLGTIVGMLRVGWADLGVVSSRIVPKCEGEIQHQLLDTVLGLCKIGHVEN